MTPPPTTHQAPPSEWTPAQRRIFAFTFAAGLIWNLVVLLSSTGWSLDDELSHFLRSRSVWENPALVFDSWTRIGRNLFHLLPAPLGLTAARLWTLAFAALAVLITTSLAGKLGLRRAWLIPLALWFQPWFVELSWGVLTQTPFLLGLLAGIWFITTGRWVLSGLCFGFLPLIRHEGLALLALWGLAALGQSVLSPHPLHRRLRFLIPCALAAALPLAVSNAAAWIVLGELPSRIFLNAKPTEIYGHGPLWHFFAVAFVPAGPATVLLALPALPWLWKNRSATWPLAFYPAYFALHTVIFWLGLFASGGYYHFLMPLAPGLAIAAVAGTNTCLDSPSRWGPALGRLLLAGCLLQGLLLPHMRAMQHWSHSPQGLGLTREPLQDALQDALDWQATHRPHARAVVCRHIYASFSRDWIETPAQRTLNTLPPAELPPGSIAIWESKYANLTGLTLAELTAPHSDWKELGAWNNRTVIVFEKTK